MQANLLANARRYAGDHTVELRAEPGDSNGKISFDKTRAYKQSGQSAAATTNTRGEAEVLMQIMNLAQAYGLGGNNPSGASLSVRA